MERPLEPGDPVRFKDGPYQQMTVEKIGQSRDGKRFIVASYRYTDGKTVKRRLRRCREEDLTLL